MGTEVKHPLSSPPGEIWAGVMPSRSIAPAVSVALEAWQGGRVGHGHTKEYPPGNPTLGEHSLAQGQELEAVCVFVLFLGSAQGPWCCCAGSSHRVQCVPSAQWGGKFYLIIMNLIP